MDSSIKVGMDIGSTTIKIVAVNSDNSVIFKDYRRHYADIEAAVTAMLGKLFDEFGDRKAGFCITGSAGMGVAEKSGITFIQEVVAACEVVNSKYPGIKTMVDIGGEDSKMIFFDSKRAPDIRMNGNCAGGTGSFIDQVASLLNINVDTLNILAQKSTITYPISSRCGVFCKTDIQNLLSRNICKEDIAASVFRAVCIQVITSLARGHDIEPYILLCGGPLTFLPSLRNAFSKELKIPADRLLLPRNSEVFSAWGAAIYSGRTASLQNISDYKEKITSSVRKRDTSNPRKLSPFFNNSEEIKRWKSEKRQYNFPVIDIDQLTDPDCFLGIDSGSTTTKIVATDRKGRVFFHFYEKNKGNSLETVSNGLASLKNRLESAKKSVIIKGSCVTGYGEDLIRAAFPIDTGLVETIAHYVAACRFNPQVSFILDIGGQDMKAIFIRNGVINRIEINEACSSGCGSFIEEFARSLNYSSEEFSAITLKSENPCDLGTRCTVFMNSKVKQSLREGSPVPDIAAGLGYSVIRNCLYKVLKMKDFSEMGENIMVQGGSFRNISIIRALELETGKSVMITDFPELMGAYGAALHAIKASEAGKTRNVSLSDLTLSHTLSRKTTVCKGCENQCTVTLFEFRKGKKYFTGNKCEKVFCNSGSRPEKGINLFPLRKKNLFDRNSESQTNLLRIGMPRALGIYENYPFWHTLLTRSGFDVVLSDPSTSKLYNSGIGSIMSDNICFPAKLVNGHVLNLVEKKVDRIFMPFVVYEKKDDKNSANSFNCPIVTGYSEVIKSSVDTAGKYGIPFDAPSFSFKDTKLLKKACADYLLTLCPDLEKRIIEAAFAMAVKEQRDYEIMMKDECKKVIGKANADNRLVILLAGRPYHTDPYIQHKIAEIISDFGADVITDDIARDIEFEAEKVQSITQWAYTNRIFKSALWASSAPGNVQFIETTSFGCGPDAFILDEISDILKRKGKISTFLKIDDIDNPGSTRLRIRSLIESLRLKNEEQNKKEEAKINTPAFTKRDRQRKILVPWFADFYAPFFPAFFKLSGYEAEILPPGDQISADYGLKYSNNEICYPATLVVGDFIKALKSGRYDTREIALGITQTGGQCRATNYIALLKKALLAAGYNDIPVISIALGNGINEQPGFSINWFRIYKSVIACMLYADCLSQLYYSTAPREKEPGMAETLKFKYLNLGTEALSQNSAESFFPLVKKMAEDFESISNHKNIPKIGIVGEIYVKYNSFANKNIINWLITQGIEPVVPPLTNFFTDGFANLDARIYGSISTGRLRKMFMDIAESYIEKMTDRMEKNVSMFPGYRKIKDPYSDAKKASQVINLNSQFGEGWRIPAEFINFAEAGIYNVISVQPFGCIANHIVSKGIEKRISNMFPEMNILSLDFDSGISDVNIYNRLYFMVKNARDQIIMKEPNHRHPGFAEKESAALLTH